MMEPMKVKSDTPECIQSLIDHRKEELMAEAYASTASMDHSNLPKLEEPIRNVETLFSTDTGASSSLFKYSREELLKLREHNIDSSHRWAAMATDMRPVVHEMLSLDIKEAKPKHSRRHKQKKSVATDPHGVGSMEFSLYPGCEEPSLGVNDYEIINDLEHAVEQDFEESDYEESLQRLAFFVEGEPDFDSGPPQDGFEYLRRVMWESAQCPKVVKAKIDPKKLYAEQTPYMPKIAPIPVCSPDLLPSLDWKREFIADFSQLRQALSKTSLPAENILKKLPPNMNGAAWKRFCFGKPARCKVDQELEDDVKHRDGSSEPEDFLLVNSELSSNNNSVDEAFMDVAGGHSPLLKIVLSLDEISRATLFRYHVSWLEELDFIACERALWLFALSAVVDKPLDDLTSASFRALLRKCASLREAKKCRDEELYMLNILITIAGNYFGQADELVV